MKRLRFIFIFAIVVSVVGLFVSLYMRKHEDWLDSDAGVAMFERRLHSVDSIFKANDKDPEGYAKFRASVTNMSPQVLESECYRSIITGNSRYEEMFGRVLVERYSRDMPEKDAIGVVKVLNNLGCIYYEKNDLPSAYVILKTGYEMSRKYDATRQSQPAFLVNLADIFSNYGDSRRAMSLYVGALDIAYGPEFDPGDHRKLQSARIHTLISYIHFLWMVDSLDSISGYQTRFERSVRNSTYEYYGYARYLNSAAVAYVDKNYIRSASLLDSAASSLNFSFVDPLYSGICRLLCADAMFNAGDYVKMNDRLDSAEKVITANKLDMLYPYLYKGREMCFRKTGDSIRAAEARAKAIVIRDSLFGNRNYAMLRDIQSDWDKAWYDVRVSGSYKADIWIIVCSICLILSCMGFAFTFLYNRKKRGENKVNIGLENEVDDDIHEDIDTDIVMENTMGESEEIPEEEAVDSDDESEESLMNLYHDMCRTMEHGSSVYDIDFSINTLAKEMGVSSRRISRAVNLSGGINFSSFVAGYRVKEACRILDEAVSPLERPTMDSLAERVGYKSRAHLSRVFKAVMGVPPAEYKSRTNISEPHQ